MRTVVNLDDGPAIAKMKQLAEEIKICLFCTNVKDIPFDVRPMHVVEVDAIGDFWFFSILDSNKNDEIQLDSKVQLLFAKPAYRDFLSVYGFAEIVTNEAKQKLLWNKADKSWFPDGGIDSQGMVLIRVITRGAYYWDSKQSIAQIALNSAMASINQDRDITEGDLVL
jgi:general stress protein 26